MTFEWWFAYLGWTSIILSLSPLGAINTMTTSINHGYRGVRRPLPVCRPAGYSYRARRDRSGDPILLPVLAFEVLKWAGGSVSDLAGHPAVARGRLHQPGIRLRRRKTAAICLNVRYSST